MNVNFARRNGQMRVSAQWCLVACLLLLCTVIYMYQNQSRCMTKADVYLQGDDRQSNVQLQALSDIQRSGQGSGQSSALHVQDFQPLVIPAHRNASFNYQAAMDKLNEAKVNQDDPRLIKLIRDYYLEPPSLQPYHLDNPDRLEYSNGQTPFVDSRLNYMEDGFYIECGALNGEKGSNTLFFEKVRRWNGLLIEADPENYAALKKKNRKSYTINACLNTKPYPSMMTFNKAFNRGRVVHDEGVKDWMKAQRIEENGVRVQCFPLFSILLAMNQLTVHFFSLDVEGDELNVLTTLPWQRVDIHMMTIEFIHEVGKGKDLKSYVEKQGYDALLSVSRWDGGVNDIIFRKKGLSH